MIETSTLLAFMAASAAIIMIPGPAQAMVLARTLSDGRRAGVLTAVGLNVGTIGHAVAAGMGVSALLAASATAFSLVQYAGTAYLLHLGVQAWRAGDRLDTPPVATGRSALARAMVTGVLNPKVALFFVAFLPQFVDASQGSVLAQCLLLGSILALMDVVYETALVWLASGLAGTLQSRRTRQWQSRFTGAVLVGLGLKLALAERR